VTLAGLSRRERLLGDLDTASLRGLEFGPLTKPIVLPEEGAISYVDYLTTAGLRAKYRDDPNVDTSGIVDVDVVLEAGGLPAAVLTSSFDYVVASHVLEHLPDPLGWLEQCVAALKPGGTLCLALPDKRYTWDILRRDTEVWAWVDGYVMGHVLPTPGQVFEATSRTALMRTGVPWEREPTPAELQPERDPSAALEFARLAATEHVDVHCSVFTPATFLRLLGDAHRVGLCRFELGRFHDTRPGEIEFFVQLRYRPDIDAALAALDFEAAAAFSDRRSNRSRLRRWRRRWSLRKQRAA